MESYTYKHFKVTVGAKEALDGFDWWYSVTGTDMGMRGSGAPSQLIGLQYAKRQAEARIDAGNSA